MHGKGIFIAIWHILIVNDPMFFLLCYFSITKNKPKRNSKSQLFIYLVSRSVLIVNGEIQ